MKPFLGKAVAVDQTGFAHDFQWKPKFITSVVDYTVSPSESGCFFLNTAATEAEIVFTLPAISTGPWIFFFLAVADVALKVAAATADTLLAFNDAEADSVSFATSSEIMGAGFMVWCDGTTVGAIPLGAGGHVQTLTVTS
jgi:hypothetical protein